ncbi:FAD-dependent oxidoreductase [Wenjunlia vitaminophila]|uniref:FAD-dependent oxidoreductase n=1 Tax=Wenjunlia vitaminophila TaxID=76728 RepID=A0A0T6LMG3_WENVI|nr:FAD-dependent monooxygenase [Wenjunlia vitaminophila]KRV47259.1 FAD-dependent oxidoreductase [Wenjunlia vitaminophila]
MHTDADTYDVAVLGSGMTGALIGACLARNSAKVVIIDSGTHPRLTLGEGESTPLYTGMLLRLIAERYGVPEIKYLASFEAAQSKISRNGGVARNFGYVYHREGRRQDPREAHMLQPPTMGFTPHHLFRQDTDAWLLTVAAKYGADVRQQQRVTDVDVTEDAVTIGLDGKPPIRARYVVDAGGERSVLAERFALREGPSRFRHHARTLANHMLGVRPYDEIAPTRRYGNPGPWHEGSLHHVFHGGWMWVYPYGNHPRSTNPLCGVGLQLDPRVHPAPDCSPEEEFRRFVARFPDIAAQFDGAVPVQEWVRTERRQYSSKQVMGHRWFLAANSAGFVDPLFSGDLTVGLETVHALTHRLLDAVREDDFATERFEDVRDLVEDLLDNNDDVCANAFVSFRDFSLWDVWYRVWYTRQILRTYEINRRYANFLRNRDTAELAVLERPWWRGRKPPQDVPYAPAVRFLQEANERFQAIGRGEAGAETAATDLMRQLSEGTFTPPVFGLGDPRLQWTSLPTRKMAETLNWTRRTAPRDIAELTLDGLFLFMRVRLARGESHVGEELRQLVAGRPRLGRRLRVPTPK